MANVGDALPHCTGTGTELDPYIFDSEQGFLEAIAVYESYVEAKSSGLSFDCNNGIITAPIELYCCSLKGKGLTIRNALLQNTSDKRIVSVKYQPATSQSGNPEKITFALDSVNFYNFCIIVYNGDVGILQLPEGWSGYRYHHGTAGITNCNFAGVYIGYPSTIAPLIGVVHDDRWEGYNGLFKNCTFNVNFSDPTNTEITDKSKRVALGSPFHGQNGAYNVRFDNCTVCYSGNVKYTISLAGVYTSEFYGDGNYFNNCTFTNDPDNPLACYSYHEVISIHNTYSGYNYHKMNVSTTDILSRDDSLGLFNNDTYHAGDGRISGGIYMQGTNGPELLSTKPVPEWDDDCTQFFKKVGNNYVPVDPGTTFVANTYYEIPDNYIYCDTNLAAKNFLVGRVIT